MTSAAVAAAKEESRKISFDDFLKALRRALPTKSERSHNKLAKALSLEVKASRGVDFESVLGISDPPQVDTNATVGSVKRPQPPGSGSGAPIASKHHEPEAPRYITASNGYVRKNSKFIDLLHIQVSSWHSYPILLVSILEFSRRPSNLFPFAVVVVVVVVVMMMVIASGRMHRTQQRNHRWDRRGIC